MTDVAIKNASDLTDRQLEEAIEIVEAEFGEDVERRNDGLIAAVLIALAGNCRRESAAKP